MRTTRHARSASEERRGWKPEERRGWKPEERRGWGPAKRRGFEPEVRPDPASGSGAPRDFDARDRDRATAPIGVVLLVAVAVVLAAGVATATLDAPDEPPPTASVSVAVDGDRIELRHRAGDAIRVDELDVRVRIDGEPLDRQPPVPFFSAAGFRPGPTGPFNAASDDVWRPGESASFRVAGTTNAPVPEPGRTVEVRLSVRDRPIVTLETVVTAR